MSKTHIVAQNQVSNSVKNADFDITAQLNADIEKYQRTLYLINMRDFLKHMKVQRELSVYDNTLIELSQKLAETNNAIQLQESDAKIFNVDTLQDEINNMLAEFDNMKAKNANMLQ